ncbi:tyrosine--tRNA ligase [Candidatus Comchoanobacter bicostacola]|uniref:Tyrosine--tRNA ligase n=1 Tax=Candidatus Comchoanobacter bicostacola TaxID=2919598 RepID=A0ABY5DK35_9GAMM|nr:tyrosine--tRNA ligase [Candidatus Comchoanobacter bicostacola]UTC24347.1 tyrosine--tRNA ligase [Candidatus Comchoanobacter bicostacola]
MPSDDLAQLLQGSDSTLPEDALSSLLKEGRQLTVKAGFDPTAADLHLGHTVLIEKLRQFQDLGHKVVFIVGDYTALIGDPSGRNATRPPLSPEQVNENARTYTDQVFKILDPEKTVIKFNNEWLGKLTSMDLVHLSATQTVARMLERDDFSKRYKSNQPISIHEFLYPLLQGYDSYAIESDIELGGTDQTFNLLMGREVQKAYGMKQQAILTVPLLEGLDGVKKMSKSYDNYIGLNDTAIDMYGKVMSISDELMWRYYTLVSGLSVDAISKLKTKVTEGTNPRDLKRQLAHRIVQRFHSKEDADKAQEAFINQFSKGGIPEDIQSIKLSDKQLSMPLGVLLRDIGLVSSSSEGSRMIKQGAVRLDGQVITSLPELSQSHVLQVGKRRLAKIS